MQIQCENCGVEHELEPPSWVISSGRAFRFRCSSCGHSQSVQPPTGIEAPEELFAKAETQRATEAPPASELPTQSPLPTSRLPPPPTGHTDIQAEVDDRPERHGCGCLGLLEQEKHCEWSL